MKPNYKAIVDKAIGEKPSLVKPHLEKFGKETMNKVDDKLSNLIKYPFTLEEVFSDYPVSPDQSFEYKQQTYQEFLNDKQDTK